MNKLERLYYVHDHLCNYNKPLKKGIYYFYIDLEGFDSFEINTNTDKGRFVYEIEETFQRPKRGPKKADYHKFTGLISVDEYLTMGSINEKTSYLRLKVEVLTKEASFYLGFLKWRVVKMYKCPKCYYSFDKYVEVD